MNINKIKISGTTYSIQDENACNVVELTQAEYDALPATAKTSNSLFVITDAQGADLSNYYTKSETSGATQISTALASKADTATTYTKTEVDNAITAATSTKQDTLVSGTNIKTINNESILGSGNITIEGGGGGGKAVSAGTNISITTGETADTINCTLPIVNWGNNNIAFTDKGYGNGNYTLSFGDGAATPSFFSMSLGNFTNARGNYSVAIGYGGRTYARYSNAFGYYTVTNNERETAQGVYNNSVSASTTFGDSGNTLFSVGNGTDGNARHNAFEIRQNGDIYLTKDGQDVKLQDQLGGTVDTEITSASTNPVTSAAIYNQLGGLKLVKLTQAQYNALATKDSMTLYVIEEAPQCNIPSTATWHAVDDNFDKTTQIYGVDFGSGDGGNDGTGRDYYLQVKNANNIIYNISCHIPDPNADNGDYSSIRIDNADGSLYRQFDYVAAINSFCELFGEPMYISANSAIPSYEACIDEQCTEYDCLQYDEETGECIEQGDCINTECMQTETTYFMTALY